MGVGLRPGQSRGCVDHHKILARSARNELIYRRLETGTVDDDGVGFCDLARVLRSRFKAVRIAPDGQYRRDLEAVAGDVLSDIGQKAGLGYHCRSAHGAGALRASGRASRRAAGGAGQDGGCGQRRGGDRPSSVHIVLIAAIGLSGSGGGGPL